MPTQLEATRVPVLMDIGLPKHPLVPFVEILTNAKRNLTDVGSMEIAKTRKGDICAFAIKASDPPQAISQNAKTTISVTQTRVGKEAQRVPTGLAITFAHAVMATNPRTMSSAFRPA